MNKYHCLILIFTTLLAACTPPTMATPSMTGTAELLAPTVLPTFTPAPVSIPISEISLDNCTRILQTHISDSGVLNALYANSINEATIFSKFGYYDSHTGTGLTRWSDDTQQAIPYTLPENTQGPSLSPNGELVIYRHDSGENLSEIRVTDVNGQNERTLAKLDYSEIEKHYPSGVATQAYTYEWIPNTNRVVFSVDIYLDDSEYAQNIYDQVAVVDVISGNTIFLESPAEIQFYKFSPDGRQMAIQTEQELRVIDTGDGGMLFENPSLPTNDFVFSPDARYILEFIEGGIQRTDTRDGDQQLIPLDYTVMHTRVEGPSISPLPDFRWTDDTHILLSSLNSEQQFLFAINQANPNWTFTIFQVDIANGTPESVQTFDGSPHVSFFSPDNKHLAFWKYEGNLPDQKRNLYIADVISGEILEIIEMGEFRGWFPDSERYLYATGISYPLSGKGDPGSTEVEVKYYLGQIGKESVQINWDSHALAELRYAQWIDANRLLGECKIYTFE
jgi:hypothetical protein